MQQAVTSGGNPIPNQAKIKRAYDYIVIGSGAAGSIIAGELSKTGADILVVEAGGEDVGATVTDPSIWFYNVGGPLRLVYSVPSRWLAYRGESRHIIHLQLAFISFGTDLQSFHHARLRHLICDT